MKSVICVCFLTICVATSIAAVSRGQYNDSKNPGKCTIKENIILSPDEEIKDPDTDCGRIICESDGLAQFQTCGTQMMEGCKSDGYLDKSLPYPDCCELNWICS